MNEITKNYYEMVNERSITAKSSHAKNGQNSEKLGNKQLTRKEIEEKHGPVKTYTFDDFLSFSEFREMPLDWQAAYINNLQDKYDIGLTQIGRDLFGHRDDNMLRSHLKLKGILDKVNPDKRHGRTKLHDFRRDIRVYRTTKEADTIATPDPVPAEKPAIFFMNYETFKNLSNEKQAAFINRIIKEYDVGVKNIGEEIFGLKDGCILGNYLRRKLPDGMLNVKHHAGDTRSARYKAKLERFRSDIQLWKNAGSKQSIVILPEINTEPDKPYASTAEFETATKQLDTSIQKLNDRVKKG